MKWLAAAGAGVLVLVFSVAFLPMLAGVSGGMTAAFEPCVRVMILGGSSGRWGRANRG